ncbi:MAG: M23 family metallopeptidase [Helicobacteraceae bacterium]|jgi:murein DD-endopeptidase MepM/ murein hydrolase activator NlpD|nr:M23 family metallopeptidase [Helicobacteraceae bacterium]
MRYYNPRKSQRTRIVFFVVLIAAIALFAAFSPIFERNAPEAKLLRPPYWNPSAPLTIQLTDDRALKRYKIALAFENEKFTLAEGDANNVKELSIAAKYPPNKPTPKDRVTLTVEATDSSLWNFFRGNGVSVAFDLIVDREPPVVNIVANSYSIASGGSALVVFEAGDGNIDEIKIVTKNGRSFAVAPYYKPRYYAALIAREIGERDFTAYALATDLAGNQNRVRIPLYLKEVRYKESSIELTKTFLEGKADDLNFRYNPRASDENLTALDRFIFVNETLRAESLKTIELYTSPGRLPPIDGFEIGAFAPLPRSKMVAGFGERRVYTFERNRVSESYHLGIDLASVKEAAVFASNGGAAVFASDNGVYGNTPIIHHGLGLFTLYGHCASLHVAQGDDVSKGMQIGVTGVTGFAFGDHTHFEARVQGVAVTPIEWMDSSWIRVNVLKVQEDAKKIIDGRTR